MYNNDIVYMSLGSNIEHRKKFIEKALKQLEQFRIKVETRSPLYRTEPVGVKDQPEYLNLVVKAQTSLAPLQVLVLIKNIEEKLGRLTGPRWGSREIDIDILMYNDIILKSERLTIPHPEIMNRKFVLIPLNDIAPDLKHPETGKTVKEMLEETKDASGVKKYK